MRTPPRDLHDVPITPVVLRDMVDLLQRAGPSLVTPEQTDISTAGQIARENTRRKRAALTLAIDLLHVLDRHARPVVDLEIRDAVDRLALRLASLSTNQSD